LPSNFHPKADNLKMRFLIFIILFTFTSGAFGQVSESNAPNAQPGKCYELCYIPSIWKTYELEVPVYTGPDDDKVIEREAQFFTAQNGEEIRVVVVRDRSKADFYTLKKFTKRVILEKGDFEEWREVLCAENLTSNIINQMQEALIVEDFLPEGYIASEDFEPEFKNALIGFQKEYNLPIGHFDFETLEALEIDFEN